MISEETRNRTRKEAREGECREGRKGRMERDIGGEKKIPFLIPFFLPQEDKVNEGERRR